jgi:hypothetical protein
MKRPEFRRPAAGASRPGLLVVVVLILLAGTAVLSYVWHSSASVPDLEPFSANPTTQYDVEPDDAIEPARPAPPAMKSAAPLAAQISADASPSSSQPTSSVFKGGCSDNHDEDGKNVLYGDGQVDFQRAPWGASTTQPATHPRSLTVDPNDTVILPVD